MRRWSEHFRSVLNRSPPENPVTEGVSREVLTINTEPPGEEKIIKALKGHSGQMPCFPHVLAIFLNYLHEISFNPKMLPQGCSVCSHKSVRIFSRFLK